MKLHEVDRLTAGARERRATASFSQDFCIMAGLRGWAIRLAHAGRRERLPIHLWIVDRRNGRVRGFHIIKWDIYAALTTRGALESGFLVPG
jgi:hypothetical protein